MSESLPASRVPGQRLWTQDRLALVAAWPLFCVLVGLALWIGTFAKIEQDRRAAVSDAEQHLTSEVAEYADALSSALQKADQLLELVRFETGLGSPRLDVAAHQGVFPRTQQLGAFVLDAHGAILSSTAPGLGDSAVGREYFQFHLRHADDLLNISEPLPEHSSTGANHSVILLTRRMGGPDGNFDGVAAISLPLSYFNTASSLSNQEDGDFSAVVGRDGGLRALRLGRRSLDPANDAAANRLGPSPLFASRTGSGSLASGEWLNDHEARLYAWQALDDLPLVAVVGSSERNYLAGYRRLRQTRLSTASALSVLLLALAVIGSGLAAQLIARHHREANNRTSYRIATEGGKDGFFMFLPVYDEYNRMIDLQVTDCNARGAAMLGYARDNLKGLYWSHLWTAKTMREILALYECVSDAGFLEEETELDADAPFLKQIHWIRQRIARTGDVYATALSDVTDEHRLRQELVTLANQDLLTDLRNRNWLINNLPELLEAASLRERQLAILFIDFDRFKQINDLMGHTAGDELLKAAAMRMAAAVRDSDHVVHMGGDEFLIILDSVSGEETARNLADYLLQSFKQPFALSRGAATINLSLGITLYPRDGDSADILLRNADLAMHNAKTHGRGQYRFYDAWLYEIIKAKLDTELALGQGLARDEFLLHYQPRVSAADGRLLGFEALVRWQQPGRGLVPPGEFIPLAEETGLIVQLGAHVMELACRQLADWRRRFAIRVPVAVNVSARQFAHSNVRAALRAALDKYHLSADALEVEITESSMLEQDLRVYQDLLAIRDMGIKILVDDFGTGYSSLSQLQRLELDVLKIDKSFVSELHCAADSEVIVRMIISMAHALQMTVVAEGVETHEQLQILQQLGCDEIQGYFVARPMSAADAEACLADPLRYAALIRPDMLVGRPGNEAAM